MRLNAAFEGEDPMPTKMWLRRGLELVSVILLVPQAFIFCYYFSLFFSGRNRWALAQSLSRLALSISWVSAPVFVLVVVTVWALMGRHVRRSLTFLFCLVAGYAWIALWNLLVFKTFSYGRSAIPVFLCSLCTAGYALARSLYLEGLPPVRAVKNEAPDLSE